MEQMYSVRQTVEKTGVKSHVLRYWEEELGLYIHRNEMGHRCYTANDIQLFLNVKELKDRGMQLKAIRDLVPQTARIAPGSTQSKIRLLEGEVAEPIAETAGATTEVTGTTAKATEVLVESAEQTAEAVSATRVCDEKKILAFQRILERLIYQELELQRSGEHRYRSLDRSIRERQTARREAAAALAAANGGKKKKKAKVL